MPTRISGKVYGDLTGSIFEPQVKSIANVDSGTLPVAHGGTGLNVPGASGSALVSDGTSLVYAVISGGGGGVTAGEVSGAIDQLTASISSSYVQNSVLLSYSTKAEVTGAIDQLTSSLSSSYVQNTILNDYALKSGTIFTGPVTASNGVSSSYYVLSNGYQLSSSEQFTQSINLNVYASKEEVTGAINQLTSSLSSSYVQNSTLNNYALISGVTFTGAITASSGISSSLIRFPDGTELTSSTGLGGGLSSVYTDGNITGSGLIGDKIGLKDNITLTSVTASLFGSASYSLQTLSASYASTISGQLRLITGAERALLSPTVGLMLYQTDISGSDSEGVYVYKSSGWVQMI